MLQDN
ncbi:Protein of unknown function [Bacillus mycoides]